MQQGIFSRRKTFQASKIQALTLQNTADKTKVTTMPLPTRPFVMAATPPNDSLTDMEGLSLFVSKSGSKNGTFTTIITENNAA
ncbi:hypothetical protein [Klebsiella variicola]|uniref:hypothetical protein n=1 Tax=Klebsiella variicola TaxID=244366 RepID=UPI00101BEAFA|nr:hypothetical protein [Klebsiella variicola]HBZ7220557.1 hypothetical protein [Klebsiella variicola subsp. variicola]EKU9430607.1 hypothetical protein [Klebsiella variicola]EKZ5829668.1 hypothetical protein [Klebsiella variicola]MDM7055464.1 hypothetical protein [Klebsiella variicola]MEA5435666.1 hypothetical protein [Klebsiella variicola]